MTRHPLRQRAIDALLPIAGEARQQLGPDDDTTRLLGRVLDMLYRGKASTGKGGGGKRIKARLANGEPVTIDARMIEREDK